MPKRDDDQTAESAATDEHSPASEVDRCPHAQALRERVCELAAAPPESRDDLLAAADTALPAADAQVLHAVFDPPNGSLVLSDALRVAREAGYTRADAVALFATSLHAADLQERWARSQDIEARDEVLLRLQVLAGAPRVDAELVPFLMLSLRSPDPAVYQTAAVAIGRHLDVQPDLLADVRKYAAARDLDLGTPTGIDGTRTRRRILLVQAAARANAHPDDATAALPDLLTDGLPLDPTTVDTESAMHAEDATVLLLASRLLLDVPDLVADVAPMARDLVTSLPADDVTATPPILLQRWGELLDALLARELLDASSVADAWRDVLNQIAATLENATAGDVLTPTRACFLLDEHARTVARLPDAVGADAASAQEGLPATLRALLQTRVRLWRHARSADTPPGWPTDPSTVPSNASPALRVLLRPRPTYVDAGVGGVGPVEFDLETIDDLLAPLSDRTRWETLPSSERALHAAFLLITMQNVEGAYERVASILRTHAIPIPPGNDVRSRALAAVILRLIQFEGAACARAIDTRILESVSDLGVLLTLLPTDESPALAADLADNFEHQLRWNLHHDPGFRPIQLLVRTTVRNPHPAFYRALQDIVARRTYTDSTGQRVPLDDALNALSRDDVAIDDPWRRNSLVHADRLVSARSRARDRLAAVTADEGSLWEMFDQLLAAIGVPTGPQDKPADDTLLGVVGLIHPAANRMVASGTEPWYDDSPGSFVATHAETVSSMRARLATTRPERLDDAADAYDAIQSLDDTLEALVSALRPVLPVVEADRLGEIASAIDARIDAYAQALDRLVAMWDPLDPPRSRERWQHLLDEVSGHWEAPDRLPVLRAMFASLDDASVPLEGADPWAARRAFLTWAVTAPDGRTWVTDEINAWTAVCADVWEELLEEAMNAGQESRVRDLLETPAFERLRDRSESVAVLRTAREWAHDRYLLGVATRVRERLPTTENAPEWRVRLQETGAFLLHHSAVWTALIVGAIFMEDFGTAWQAMAAQGDIQGIAITFVLAVAGAFGYVLLDLHRKTTRVPGAGRWTGIRSRLTRASAFVAVCWTFTLIVTAFLWWLLSGTDQVVHGPGALLHVIVWSSFALLTGIFLGLVAKEK